VVTKVDCCVVRKVTRAVTFEECSLCFQGWSELLCTLRIAQKGRMRGKVRIKHRLKHRRTLWITLLLFVLSSKRVAKNITGCLFYSLSFFVSNQIFFNGLMDYLYIYIYIYIYIVCVCVWIYIYNFKNKLIQFSQVGVGSKHPKRNLGFIDNYF
jgi:hypothetical protein